MPYWGLRDYGVDGQIGLEETPEQYIAKMVEVFAEVRRVLRNDGTLWLNIGDSYAGSWGNQGRKAERGTQRPINGEMLSPVHDGRYPDAGSGTGKIPGDSGLKPKDLVGIPWALATALREPRYTGTIKDERDRIWLAATLDAEGSICGSTHVRKDNGRTRTSLFITITNADTRMLDEASRIWSASRVDHNTHGVGHLGNRPTFRWLPHGAKAKSLLCRELLPYLIVKKKQALLGWRFCELSQEAKRLARSPQAKEATDQRAWIMDALSRLNRGQDVDIPTWVGEPPSLTEPGWYLRRDIIWNKPNPMPESVTDRPTSSHEYLFLLSKSPRYFYDAEAIREGSTSPDSMKRPDGWASEGRHEAVDHSRRERQDKQRGHGRRHDGFNERWDLMSKEQQQALGRNKRSVWTIATRPYTDAHFATFPPDLVEPCVLAGTAPKAMVLDPFAGASTTGLIAVQHNRDFIGIELNPEYVALGEQRIRRWEHDPAGVLAPAREASPGQLRMETVDG